jgi:hypothetical protein
MSKVSKVVSIHATEAQIYSFLTLALDGGENLEVEAVSVPRVQHHGR